METFTGRCTSEPRTLARVIRGGPANADSPRSPCCPLAPATRNPVRAPTLTAWPRRCVTAPRVRPPSRGVRRRADDEGELLLRRSLRAARLDHSVRRRHPSALSSIQQTPGRSDFASLDHADSVIVSLPIIIIGVPPLCAED